MKGVRDIHGDKNEAFALIPLTVTLHDETEISRGQGLSDRIQRSIVS